MKKILNALKGNGCQARMLTAAMVVLSAMAGLTSCANEDTALDNTTAQTAEGRTVQFTATLAPKGDNGGQTRAITTGTDGEGKEILNVTWKKNEQIAIYYETTNGHETTTATVQSVDSETGAATISATFAADAKDKGTAKFVFPASLANDTGDIDNTKLLNNQKGTLADISENFDAATATGAIAVSGSIAMQNQVCICKFHFDLDDGTGSSVSGGSERTFSPIIINDGNGHTYTITSNFVDDGVAQPVGGTPVYRGFKSTDDIYIAMLPVSGKTVSFYNCSLGSMGYNNYLKAAPNTTLTAGKFYRNISITLTKDSYTATQFTFKDLSAGSITATSGDFIYQSNSEATANTITILDGANATLYNVNISATGSAGVTCSGDAAIYLKGTNTVTATLNEYPAVQAGGSGKTLTINGSGSLTATGGRNGAGIGSRYNSTCGNITIGGGTVTANGGVDAAGIGSGNLGTCGNITINGGTIESTGSYRGAGIGSGGEGHCGNITISTSVVKVIAKRSTIASYCIGKGYGTSELPSTCGTITIGGTVRSQEDFTGESFTYKP